MILLAHDPGHQVLSNPSPCERRIRWPTSAAPPLLTASETYLQGDGQQWQRHWLKAHNAAWHTVVYHKHKSLTSHRDQLLHCKLLPSVKQVAVGHRRQVLEERARGGALIRVNVESEDGLAAPLQVYLCQWVDTFKSMHHFLKTKHVNGLTCIFFFMLTDDFSFGYLMFGVSDQ